MLKCRLALIVVFLLCVSCGVIKDIIKAVPEDVVETALTVAEFVVKDSDIFKSKHKNVGITLGRKIVTGGKISAEEVVTNCLVSGCHKPRFN
jgi:hypothetical protein